MDMNALLGSYDVLYTVDKESWSLMLKDASLG
jgi:hypothetical protein